MSYFQMPPSTLLPVPELPEEIIRTIVTQCDPSTFVNALCISSIHSIINEPDKVRFFADYAGSLQKKHLARVPINSILLYIERCLGRGKGSPEAVQDAFFWACEVGHVGAVRRLVDAGADTKAFNGYALRIAGMGCHIEVFRYLISRGAVKAMWHIEHAVKTASRVEGVEVASSVAMVRYLVQLGASRNLALEGAASSGKTDLVRLLLTQGADIHSTDDYALRWACTNGHLATVRLLVENGANLRARSDSPVIEACVYGHLDIVRYLVSQGADVHVHNGYCLNWSATHGHIEIVRYLVAECKVDVHSDEDAPLRCAAQCGHLEIVRFLIARGADVHARGDYPLVEASGGGHLETVQFLIACGADVSARDNAAIIAAAGNMQESIVRYLVLCGADIRARNDFASIMATAVGNPSWDRLLVSLADT